LALIYCNILYFSGTRRKVLKKKKRGPGRPSFHTKHPELVPCVRSFIEQSSAEAHLRRRTSVMYTNGVSLQDIVNHVKKTLGITVTRNTIHRLMKPPRKKILHLEDFLSLWLMQGSLQNEIQKKRLHTQTFTIHVPRST